MSSKGIVLAGGLGSRLGLLSQVVGKQLLPVYDKPMIYYPIATLMAAGVRHICIVTNSEEEHIFRKILGDGSQLGMRFEYVKQPSPDGLPQAFVLCEKFIGDDDPCLILGDNLFVGAGLGRNLRKVESRGAHIFLYQVESPEKYGNVGFSKEGAINEIVEKPTKPLSRFAIPGLYFFDNSVIQRAKSLQKSSRGEFEIVDLLKQYLAEESLGYTPLSRGTVWLDTGTPEDLFLASEYVRIIQKRQGTFVACLEEIALRNNWIDTSDIQEMSIFHGKSAYSQYLRNIVEYGIPMEPKFL